MYFQSSASDFDGLKNVMTVDQWCLVDRIFHLGRLKPAIWLRLFGIKSRRFGGKRIPFGWLKEMGTFGTGESSVVGRKEKSQSTCTSRKITTTTFE